MLRTNLSTRPFYNERLVYVVLAALALAVLAVTAFNLREAFVLSGSRAQLQARADEFGQRARTLRGEAARLRSGINPAELEATSAAAREANAIIERRAFSWTALFNRFEETLPDDVRITSVRPKVDKDGSIAVSVILVARGVKGVDAFIESLERQGTFSGLLSREEFVNEDGLLRATIEGRYRPARPAPAGKGATP